MTLLMMDGFDHYTPGDAAMAAKWTENGGAGGGTWTTPAGRVAGNCLQITRGAGTGNTAASVLHNTPTTQSTLIMGFAYRCASVTIAQDICSIDDGSTGTNQIQVRGSVAGSGQIAVFRNGTQIGSNSATNVLLPSTWAYIEVVAVIASGTAGSVAVWVDNVQVLNITGVNTEGSTTTNATRVYLGDRTGNSGGGTPQLYDDFYLLNTGAGLGSTGTPLGDSRVVTSLPSGNSADTAGHDQWAQVGGTAGSYYTSVNDNPQNGDTSYVSSATVNQIESFVFPALPAAVSAVRALQFNVIARTDDAGTRQIAPTQRNGSTDSVGPTSPNLPSTYTDEIFVAETSLQTGVAWTVAEVNASEFGVKLIT